MQGAILKGLYGIEAALISDCPSNCTWQNSFVSLGFESECQNVTQETLHTKTCRMLDLPSFPHSRNASAFIESCNMTTPSNLTISTATGDVERTSLVIASKSLFGDERSPQPPSTDFLQIAVLRTASSSFTPPVKVEGEEVLECTLRLVAYRYPYAFARGGSFTLGPPTQFPLEIAPDTVSPSPYYGRFNESALTLVHAEFPPLTIDLWDWWAINAFFLSDMVTGNLTQSATSDPHLRSVFRHGDIAAKFTAMAQSMTDYVRSGPGSHRVQGSLVVSTLYVRVSWPWLALPLAVTLAGIVLLLWTIVWSRQATDLPLWKSSSLALLFSDFEARDEVLHLSRAGPEYINEASKTLRARLA